MSSKRNRKHYPFIKALQNDTKDNAKKVWSEHFTVVLDPMSFFHPPRLPLVILNITLKIEKQEMFCMIVKSISDYLKYC